MTPTPGRVRRLLRAAAGLAIAAVLLAGLPYTLIRLTGPPLPRHLPTWAQTQVFLTTPLTDEEIVKGLASVVWLLWAIFALSLLAEVAAAARGAPAPRLPVIAPFQAAAAALIGVIIAASLPAAHAALRPAPSLHAALTAATTGPLTAGQPAPTAAPARAARAPAPAQRYGNAAARARVYRVVPGDDLWSIAARFLGNGERWHEIFGLNQGKPQPDGRALTDPGLIYPGWVLLLSPPTSHNSSQPARRAGQPAPPRTPAVPPSPAPHRERSGGLPSPAAPSAHPHPPHVAVHLPSGALIGISVAIMVAAAVALASIQRRRRYRPRASLTASVQPDQPPLPAVITALCRATRPTPAEAPDSDTRAGTGTPPPTDPYLDLYDDSSPGPGQPAGPSARPHGTERPHPAGMRPGETDAAAQPSRAPGAIALGVRGTSKTALDLAALGGLGLTGPGAPAAARAILAALLAHTGPARTATAPAVIIPTADLTRLLPAQHTAQIPGVSAPASLNAALDEMEATLLHHARTTAARDGDPPAPTPPGGHGPAAALIATPEPATVQRLRAILESGHGLDAAAILLGPWPPGVTCHVAADGMITDVTPPDAGLDGTRLFHLGADDAAAIAAVLRDARDTLPAQPELAQPTVHPPARPGGAPQAASAPGGYLPAPVPPATAPPQPARAADTPPPPAVAADIPQADTARAADPQATGPDTARPVRLTILGPLRITAGSQEIGGGLRKARELMAFLAVHPDGASADAISEALWPDADTGHAASQRNLALRKARDMLRTTTGLTTPMWILHAAGRYRLDPTLISTDLWQFADALDQARQATTDQDRLTACRTAAGLYQGELAEGEAFEWAEPYAETARRRALDAWTTIAGILQARDPGQALAALESALAHDPYNEYLYQKIMRLQAAAGHPEAVRRTLSLLEARLIELGITPGAQTRQTAASLLGTHPPSPSVETR